jgi:transcriptional regulator with XRE-family HTH domain
MSEGKDADQGQSVQQMVGARLRAVRTRYGLSQRKLGKLAGISHATISLIEQNRLNPSVGVLLRILNSFPLSMAEFWQVPSTSPQKVFYKVEDLKKVRNKKITYWQVGGGVTDDLMIFQYERYEPGADSGVTQLGKDGQESGFLISGRMELTVGEQRRVMHPGEAYYFNGRIPHRFRVVGKEPAVMVSCTVPPSF